jgi:hypothetical protein
MQQGARFFTIASESGALMSGFRRAKAEFEKLVQ